MPGPISITQVKDGLYDIHVFPKEAKEKIMSGSQKAYIRVKGEPKQINPMEKPAGVIAVLGAGNYSSSLEMVKAMFLENCVVIHKPHHLNEETDKIWAKIFQPLVDKGAIAFCDADQGRELTQLEGLSKIYFTGGTATAQAIMNATDTPLISECGGNNPCLIAPGDRPWTEKEIHHQAMQIATMSKLNGGAVCGRVQTVVTSKHWPQREAFLAALRKAIADDTPAAGTYYPGSDKVRAGFETHYPEAEVLKPENGKYKHADFLLITDVADDGYAVKNEAFCQIISEVPLDVPANAAEYLPAAVTFCNKKLLGTLGSCILIDEDTKKAHQAVFEEAVTDLEYGGIAINTMPPFIFLSPYLTWGGNEEGKQFVSGIGNFGNLLCYENVEKSILYDSFMSPGHMMRTNKAAFDHMATNMARYAMSPTWMNITRLMGGAIVDSFKGKDF
jgi:acyl-CoA reductase-like NAD-dependent aldehyde dehydrogenase